MEETIRSARTALEAVVNLLGEIDSRRAEIGPHTREGWRGRNRRVKSYAENSDSIQIELPFIEAREAWCERFRALVALGLDELVAAREIALSIDAAVGASFPMGLPNYYRSQRSESESGVPGVFRMKAGDPICAVPIPGKPLHASDFDDARTGTVRLAPPETDLYDVELSFELSHLAAALAGPDSWRFGLVQPLNPKADWVEGASKFQAPPAPLETAEYGTRLRNLLDSAAGAGATFAVLAEGAMTDKHVDEIAAHAREAERGSLFLTVTGSRYSNVGTDDEDPGDPIFENVSEIVTYSHSPMLPPGSRIFAARKNRRSFDGLEPIDARPDRPYIKIFCIGAVKLAVVICADFSEARIRSFLTMLGVELVAVPTLTVSPINALEFARQANNYAIDTGAAVVVANASTPGRPCKVAGAVAASSLAASINPSWRQSKVSDDPSAAGSPESSTERATRQLSAGGVVVVDESFVTAFGNEGDTPSVPGLAIVSMSDETHNWQQLKTAP